MVHSVAWPSPVTTHSLKSLHVGPSYPENPTSDLHSKIARSVNGVGQEDMGNDANSMCPIAD